MTGAVGGKRVRCAVPPTWLGVMLWSMGVDFDVRVLSATRVVHGVRNTQCLLES